MMDDKVKCKLKVPENDMINDLGNERARHPHAADSKHAIRARRHPPASSLVAVPDDLLTHFIPSTSFSR